MSLLTAKELSEKTGISVRMITRMARDSKIPAYKLGNWRFDLEEVKRAFKNSYKELEPGPPVNDEPGALVKQEAPRSDVAKKKPAEEKPIKTVGIDDILIKG